MAQRVTVELVDDLDGKSGADISTVTFGLDGVTYEIDLSQSNAADLRAAMSVFVMAARRTNGTVQPNQGIRQRPSPDRAQTKAIRDWAKQKGHKVSDRGPISVEIVADFEARAGRRLAAQ